MTSTPKAFADGGGAGEGVALAGEGAGFDAQPMTTSEINGSRPSAQILEMKTTFMFAV